MLCASAWRKSSRELEGPSQSRKDSDLSNSKSGAGKSRGLCSSRYGSLGDKQQMVQAGDERLTDELLEMLLESASPEAYLSEVRAEERCLSDYLQELLQAHEATRSEVIRASGMNATYCYQVFQGTRHPSRDNVLMIAFGMGCTLEETQRMLRFAGHNELWCKVRRDAIVIFCLEHRLSRVVCDDELWRLGEKTLLSEE